MVEVKNPKPEIQLSGRDGNAFSIIGRCLKELKNSSIGYTEEELLTIREEMMSSDYDNLLRVCMKYCDVE